MRKNKDCPYKKHCYNDCEGCSHNEAYSELRKKIERLNNGLERAARILAKQGNCTHYAGFTCDKDFISDPKVCPACLKRWLLKKTNEGSGTNDRA